MLLEMLVLKLVPKASSAILVALQKEMRSCSARAR
jgi:hypothetical protein